MFTVKGIMHTHEGSGHVLWSMSRRRIDREIAKTGERK